MLRSHTPGQALVEMTLVVTLLLAVLMGTVDLALAFNTRLALNQAVAEGAYFASQNPRDDAGIRTKVRQELNGLSPAVTDGNITITRTGCATTTPYTEIQVSYSYQPIFAVVGISSVLQLQSATTVPQFGGC